MLRRKRPTRARFRSSQFIAESLEQRMLLCAAPLTASMNGETGSCQEATLDATSFSPSAALQLQAVPAAAEPAPSLDLNADGKISATDAAFYCELNTPELREKILIGDANLSGKVGFDDFLVMSRNFGRSGQHFGNGDFDCSGYVSFADFLLLSRNFGKTAEYTLPPTTSHEVADPQEVTQEDPQLEVPGEQKEQAVEPIVVQTPEQDEQVASDVCDDDGVQCVWPGQEPYFQQIMATPSTDSRIFYIQPGVHLNRLDIIGRHSDEIHFLPGAKVEGTVKATGPWNPDRGVVNIEASADLLITGLHATNLYQYQLQNENGDEQSSTALTVSWSDNIELRDSVLKGNGKLTTWIQGNSTVSMTNTKLECYYFCVGIAASDVVSDHLVIEQNNASVPGDRHAAMWISSTMRSPDNIFYGDSDVRFTDTIVKKQTGEGIIVGNGGYEYRSNVTFQGSTQIETNGVAEIRSDGWLSVHPNYFGITLNLEDDYPSTSTDRAANAAAGEMGRFVLHEYQGSGVGPQESPLVVCDNTGCTSSLDVYSHR